MFGPLLLLFLLAHCNLCTESVQPDSASRFHWVGPKLKLELRQAKRSLISTPTKLYNPGNTWKPATQSDDVEAIEVDEISGNYDNYDQLERVAEEAEQLEKMIKFLQQAVKAKQTMEPKPKRPKIDGRIRILKVCILCFLLYFRCSTVQIREE